MSRIEDRSLNGIAAADNGLTLVEMPEEAKTYLTKGMPAYRNASLALFLSGFATFSLLYCVQPLIPLFAKDFSITPTASSPFAVVVDRFSGFRDFLRRHYRGTFWPQSLDVRIAARFRTLHHRFARSCRTGTCCLRCAPCRACCLAACPPSPCPTWQRRSIRAALAPPSGLYIAGNAFGGMAGRVITGTLAEYYSWRPALAVSGIARSGSSNRLLGIVAYVQKFHAQNRMGVPLSRIGLAKPSAQSGPAHADRYRLPGHGFVRNDLQLYRLPAD